MIGFRFQNMTDISTEVLMSTVFFKFLESTNHYDYSCQYFSSKKAFKY